MATFDARAESSIYGTCEHEIQEKILEGVPFVSSEFWRYLVSLSDDLSKEELRYIWGRINKSRTDVPEQPELLFRHMLRERIISEGNVKELEIHFKILNRADLLRKTEEYVKKAGVFTGKCGLYDLELDGTTGYCGRALIFNNKTFKCQPSLEYPSDAQGGTDIDAERLKNLWESFGIQVHTYLDTDKATFEKRLDDCLGDDLSSVKILIICILSRGNEVVFHCADGRKVKISDVEVRLGTSEKLAGKPKLIFIQSCQGKPLAIPQGLEFKGSFPEEMPLPQFSDMFIGLSTVYCFLSVRNETEGSRFIQALVDVLELSGDTENLQSLVTAVNYRIASYAKETAEVIQMPSFRHQLTKWLKFKRAIPILQD